MPARGRVLVEGVVSAVRIQPMQAVPRYQADLDLTLSRRTVLDDRARSVPGVPASAEAHRRVGAGTGGTEEPKAAEEEREQRPPLPSGGRVRLVWHGQRTVPGVGAGTRLRCSGMLGFDAVGPVIYNPRYEIVSRRTR